MQLVQMREMMDMTGRLELKTGVVEVPLISSYNGNGRVFVRQVDPLPVSILSIIPSGTIPVRG